MKVDKLKSFRLLNMYEKLNRGDIINKKQFASEFGISEKSVQRDIDDLRAYLSESYESGDDITIEYDYVKGGYRLIKQEREFLTNEEIFAVAKVLLESRGFNKQELNTLIDKLMLQAKCYYPHIKRITNRHIRFSVFELKIIETVSADVNYNSAWIFLYFQKHRHYRRIALWIR